MELTDRITSRVAELTGEVEVLRKQLADAERELVCAGRPVPVGPQPPKRTDSHGQRNVPDLCRRDHPA